MVKRKESEEIKELLKKLIFSKKTHLILTVVIFLAILFSSTSIRLSNVEILKDSVTGEYLSNDLDSMYFYRQAETQLKLGHLPEIDGLRSPGYDLGWAPELIDDYLVWNYKFLRVFMTDITFNYASTISAPIFFAIGLILFFVLCLLLTKSKTASLLASAFLAYSPAFLFRSIAGFYDHDHVGVFAIFALVIVGVLSLKYYEKSWKNSIIWGVVSGFFTALVLTSWGGAITFVLVFFPLALLLQYMFNSEDRSKFLGFYIVWIAFSILFTPFLGGNADFMYSRFLDSQGLLVLFVFGFALIDSLILRYWRRISFIGEKQIHAYSFGLTAVLGLLGLFLIGKNPLVLFRKAWATLIYPFFGEFSGRVGTTVAENSQPYLMDLINQTTSIGFWFFILGTMLLCWNFSSNSKKITNKLILSGSMLFLIFAILFSRISSESLLNGENFASQALYALGAIAFLFSLSYVYQKEKFRVPVESILLFSIAITAVMNARAAVRSFFLITPFICLIGAYGIFEIIKKIKSSKDEDFKIIFWILAALLLIFAYVSLFGVPLNESFLGNYQIVSIQSTQVGPSANLQWQNAMAWVRNETPENSIFLHWWDYGYFVQTMGNRPTVSDGGRAQGEHTDHYIGRYVLTTPNPKTAASFMKTWNVSYFLIDPTEMGKYGAFSKIGSNDSWDRVSAGIFGGVSDESQTQETSTGMIRVYQLGGCVDEDISYSVNGTTVFLPGISITKTQQMQCNSYVAGAVVEFVETKEGLSIKQPTVVFFYNNKQYRIPVKYAYIGEEIVSFESGVDSVIYFIPNVNGQTGQIDKLGAIIYLSPRTFNSLMGKLYILKDPFNEYSYLEEANFEDDPAVAYFKQVYPELNEFIWYQGIRGPLKIWKVNYPKETPVYEGFLDRNLSIFGGFDYLF